MTHRRVLTPLSSGSDVIRRNRGDRNMTKELCIVRDGSTLLGTASGRSRSGRLGGSVGLGRCRGRSTKGVKVAESLGGGGDGGEEEGGALHLGF